MRAWSCIILLACTRGPAEVDADTDVDSRNGAYAGDLEASFRLSPPFGPAIVDECVAPLTLTVDETAEPQVVGEVLCATSLGDYLFTITGDITVDPEVEGTVTEPITGLAEPWSGRFDGDLLLGEFDGSIGSPVGDVDFAGAWTLSR